MKLQAVLFFLVGSVLRRAINQVQRGDNARQWLPFLYSMALFVEKTQIKVGITNTSSKISIILDELSRQGVDSKGVQPWSKILGSDGNQARYQREISLYGKYFA